MHCVETAEHDIGTKISNDIPRQGIQALTTVVYYLFSVLVVTVHACKSYSRQL